MALILSGRRTGWLTRAVWVVGGLVVALVAGVVGANMWVHLSAKDRVHSVSSVPSSAVVIVPGAGLTQGGRPSPLLAARLDKAYELLQADKAKVALLSGDNRRANHNEPVAMQKYLLGRGVAKDRIVLDYAGFDTYDTCHRASNVFGVTDAIVVSQGFHVPRAVAVCEAQGINTSGVPESVTQSVHASAWRRGYVRETMANVKALIDVTSARPAKFGGSETSVQDALQAGGTGQ